MTVLQTTGAISLQEIGAEFGDSNPISMADLYRGGLFVPADTAAGTGSKQTAPLTVNNGPIQIPTAGNPIQISYFYGTTKVTFTILQFTTSTTWQVPAGVTNVEVLVVAGGGGGGGSAPNGSIGIAEGSGGGGAGGVVYRRSFAVTPGAIMNVNIGAGGTGGLLGEGTTGGNSSFGTLTAFGGGYGGGGNGGARQGGGGGSGGGGHGFGGSYSGGLAQSSGTQGNDGGWGYVFYGGGGGGGYQSAGESSPVNGRGAAGGAGGTFFFTAPNVSATVGGGGGGGATADGGEPTPRLGGAGGVGGGGNGGNSQSTNDATTTIGYPGQGNTGGGGGGVAAPNQPTISFSQRGGQGGSGIIYVVINETFPGSAVSSITGTASASDSQVGISSSATAGFTFLANGTIQFIAIGNDVASGSVSPNWYSVTTPNVGRFYRVRITRTAGFGTVFGMDPGRWYSLAIDRSFFLTAEVPTTGFATDSGTFTVDIAESDVIVSTGTFTISANAQSSPSEL